MSSDTGADASAPRRGWRSRRTIVAAGAVVALAVGAAFALNAKSDKQPSFATPTSASSTTAGGATTATSGASTATSTVPSSDTSSGSTTSTASGSSSTRATTATTTVTTTGGTARTSTTSAPDMWQAYTTAYQAKCTWIWSKSVGGKLYDQDDISASYTVADCTANLVDDRDSADLTSLADARAQGTNDAIWSAGFLTSGFLCAVDPGTQNFTICWDFFHPDKFVPPDN